MLQRARDIPAAGVWFLCARVGEVGVAVLLVGTLMEARYAWKVGSQYIGDGSLGTGATEVSLMQRITGMALFGGYRMPVSLLVIVLVLAVLLLVLHRCQPVSHTRVLRWEWVTLWGVATLLALTATLVGVVALVAKDPFASTDPAVVSESFGPGYREQVVSNLSWPLGGLLLLLPLALWWARLPDPDDLEASLAESEGQQDEVGAAGTGVLPGAGPSARGRDADRDAIFVDQVEQIEPVERLQPRGDTRGDGSSASGYEGYFGR